MKILKKWWFWVIVVIIIIGIGSSAAKPKKVGDSTGTKQEDKKEEGPQVFKIGDIVAIKDFKVTVNKIYTVKPDEFLKPGEGKDFIAIDVTLDNISKEEQNVSSMLMFKVVDKDGRAYDYSITGTAAAKAGQLDGTVGAGRKLTGVYVVEVPKEQKGLELEFQPGFISSKQMVVKLN